MCISACPTQKPLFYATEKAFVCTDTCPSTHQFKIEKFLPVHGFECRSTCEGGFASDAGTCVFSCESMAFSELVSDSGTVLRCNTNGCPKYFIIKADARGKLYRLCVDECDGVDGFGTSNSAGQCICKKPGFKVAVNGTCVSHCGGGEFLGASGDVCVQSCPNGTVQNGAELQCSPVDSQAANSSTTAKILAGVLGGVGAAILISTVVLCVYAHYKKVARRTKI